MLSVYDNKTVIANDCVFPEDWTVDDLIGLHKSRPYNPLIANTFFRAGFIEAWGRGIQKIRDSCILAGNGGFCNQLYTESGANMVLSYRFAPALYRYACLAIKNPVRIIKHTPY